MTYQIEFSVDAERHLKAFTAHDRSTLLDKIDEQLSHEPNVPTRRRKLLRANPLATWELRVGNFRVFYEVGDDQIVIIIAIGQKQHNKLIIDGKEYQL